MANVRKQLVTEQKIPGTQFVLIDEARIGDYESYPCETEANIDDVFEQMIEEQSDSDDTVTMVVYKRYMICRRRVVIDKETISE